MFESGHHGQLFQLAIIRLFQFCRWYIANRLERIKGSEHLKELNTKTYLYLVQFDQGSAELDPGKTAGMDQALSRRLTEHRIALTVRSDGENEQRDVGMARAESLRQYLLRHGVESSLIDTPDYEERAAPSEEELRPFSRTAEVLFYHPQYDSRSTR